MSPRTSRRRSPCTCPGVSGTRCVCDALVPLTRQWSGTMALARAALTEQSFSSSSAPSPRSASTSPSLLASRPACSSSSRSSSSLRPASATPSTRHKAVRARLSPRADRQTLPARPRSRGRCSASSPLTPTPAASTGSRWRRLSLPRSPFSRRYSPPAAASPAEASAPRCSRTPDLVVARLSIPRLVRSAVIAPNARPRLQRLPVYCARFASLTSVSSSVPTADLRPRDRSSLRALNDAPVPLARRRRVARRT